MLLCFCFCSCVFVFVVVFVNVVVFLLMLLCFCLCCCVFVYVVVFFFLSFALQGHRRFQRVSLFISIMGNYHQCCLLKLFQ